MRGDPLGEEENKLEEELDWETVLAEIEYAADGWGAGMASVEDERRLVDDVDEAVVGLAPAVDGRGMFSLATTIPLIIDVLLYIIDQYY